MSLAGYSKFVSLCGITPALVSTDESVKIFKAITKNKTTEPGINSSELREILITFAISGLSTLEKEAGGKLESYGIVITEFFNWINLPVEAKKTAEILKKSANTQSINPRDKKRNNTSIFKILAES